MKVVWLHRHRGSWCLTLSEPWTTRVLFTSTGRIDEDPGDPSTVEATQDLIREVKGNRVLLIWPSRWIGWTDFFLPPSKNRHEMVGLRLGQDIPFEADELSWCYWPCGCKDLLERVVVCWTQRAPLQRWVTWLMRHGAVEVRVTSVMSEVFHLLWERVMALPDNNQLEQNALSWLIAGEEGVLAVQWRWVVNDKKKGGWILDRMGYWSFDCIGENPLHAATGQEGFSLPADFRRFLQDPRHRTCRWRLVIAQPFEEGKVEALMQYKPVTSLGQQTIASREDIKNTEQSIRIWVSFPNVARNKGDESERILMAHKSVFPEGGVPCGRRAGFLGLVAISFLTAGWSVGFAKEQVERQRMYQMRVEQTFRSIQHKRREWTRRKEKRVYKDTQRKNGDCLRRQWLDWTREAWIQALYYDGVKGRWSAVLKPFHDEKKKDQQRHIVAGMCPNRNGHNRIVSK